MTSFDKGKVLHGNKEEVKLTQDDDDHSFTPVCFISSCIFKLNTVTILWIKLLMINTSALIVILKMQFESLQGIFHFLLI